MRDIIQKALRDLEEEHNITILYAAESGSRAWGFPSPDSDYDVRFIYLHSKDWYLSIGEQRDVIDVPINDLLDINGWEIRKALQLFRKSNAPLYEWLQSPIIYLELNGFKDKMLALSDDYFSLRAGMHHYLSMAKSGVVNNPSQATVNIKKYFYILRALLSAIWIAERKMLPPMEFGLLRPLITDIQLQLEIDRLLALKSVNDEKAMIPKVLPIDTFIEQELTRCEQQSKIFEKKETSPEALNLLFRSLLHEV